MAYFDFNRLIDKYSSEFNVLSSSEGYYDEYGEYQAGKPAQSTMRGAIISLKEDKIYRSNGVLTENDRQLFMKVPLPAGLIGSTVVYKGNKYKVQNSTENAEFTGVWNYLLKHISAFNGGDDTA